jgi:2-polyprenyl-6-methoxyphenol hydroxylase-like FAD-dependent oxidoreductase
LREAQDPGDARVLERFAAMRRLDTSASIRITDFLAGAFLGANPLAGLMRGFGLTALDICLPARRFFSCFMIYGTSAMP